MIGRPGRRLKRRSTHLDGVFAARQRRALRRDRGERFRRDRGGRFRPHRGRPLACRPMAEQRARPEGIAGSPHAGPFPVGAYAAKLRDELRKRARVQLFGEVFGLRAGRAKVWFELRDAEGAVPCSMWRDAFEELRLAGRARWPTARRSSSPAGRTTTRARARPRRRSRSPSAACAWPARATCSPSSRCCARRWPPRACSSPRSACARPALPRCIGVVTGEGGKARDDVLAGLRRRGWAGRLVWAFAPVQDRHAAPAITRALQDLAAVERGRGRRGRPRRRLARRPVRLLRRDAVPHGGAAARAGHRLRRPPQRPHADRRRRGRELLDADARRRDRRAAALRRGARGAARPRRPARRARAPCGTRSRTPPRAPLAGARRARRARAAERCTRSCARFAPAPRGACAASARGHGGARSGALRAARRPPAGPSWPRGARRSTASALALAAHDPERVVERGYAVVDDRAGQRARPPPRPRGGRAPCGCSSPTPPSTRPSRMPPGCQHRATMADDDAHLRGRDRPAGGDHQAPGLRARPACARRSTSSARAAASSSSAPASSTPSARASRSCASRSSSRGSSSEPASTATSPTLPLRIEDYALERLQRDVSSAFTRVSTQIHLRGGGEEGIGEDVTYDAVDHDALQAAGAVQPLAGEWTLGSFCDHLEALDLWPAPPQREPSRLYRVWAYESAALDLALRQAGTSLHAILGLEPQPVRFVVSLRLGEPPSARPDRPGASSATRRCASSSIPPPTGRPS